MDSLVEISCLEEEKADEEESPSHQFAEPKGIAKSARTDAMEQNHAKDAEPTKKIEGVISDFHIAKIGKSWEFEAE